MAAKTEAPTPRRLRRARSEGDAPISPVLVAAASFLVVVALLPALATALTEHLSALVRSSITSPQTSTANVAWDVLSFTAPILGAGALAAVAVGLFQTQGVFAFQKLRLDFGRLDPARGLRTLLGAERLLPIVLNFVGAAFVAGLTLTLLKRHLPSLAGTTGNLADVTTAAVGIALRLLELAAVAAFALAAVDLAVRHKSWLQRLRMTKYEVQREQKESEGDPHVRRARRSVHEELLEQATLAELSRATLVIVGYGALEEERLAVALRYDEDNAADEPPRVVAHGRGVVATHLERTALAYGVPLTDDGALARALSSVKAGDAIPSALYEPVAALLGALTQDQ